MADRLAAALVCLTSADAGTEKALDERGRKRLALSTAPVILKSKIGCWRVSTAVRDYGETHMTKDSHPLCNHVRELPGSNSGPSPIYRCLPSNVSKQNSYTQQRLTRTNSPSTITLPHTITSCHLSPILIFFDVESEDLPLPSPQSICSKRFYIHTTNNSY